MTDIEDDIARYLQSKASHIEIRSDLDAVKASGRVAPQTPAGRSLSGWRLLPVAAAVVVVVAGVGSAVVAGRDETPTFVVGDGEPATTSATSAPAATDSSPSGSEVDDPTRVVLADHAGLEESRYLRIWNLHDSVGDRPPLLSEQWFSPAGDAIGTIAPVEGAMPDGRSLDPERILPLDDVGLIVETSTERDLGYPERRLPADLAGLELALADPDDSTPGAFMSVSTYGPDGSFLSSPATTSVRNLTRLLPTIMDPEARRLAFDATSNLQGAERGSGRDVLDRPTTSVTVPLDVTDLSTGAHLGLLEVEFSFEPASYAILQIEWRLVEGTLGEPFMTRFTDTTVIITAGRVAALPEAPPAQTNPSMTTTSG